MNYAVIKKYDIANGTGIRVSLFVSGCTHNCKGCFNEEAQSFDYGDEFIDAVQNDIITSLKSPYISGLTLLGGEPFEIANQRALVPFMRKVKREVPQKTIWAYTGYNYNTDFAPGGRAYCDVTDEMLSMIDVLVDGEFVEELYDISLRFRGSSNQRIINVPESIKSGQVILWDKQ
ncbi:MAG: anaerobic ribonucleoside-triphosphate reductase activating protein [Eubacteriales bacterium]|nr:anaerobic ribonucleoside-triphosphate reductase activating protein [Eubacteriales bacterium]